MIMMRGNVLLEFSDYFVKIRIQHRNPYLDLSFRRLFGDCDLDREKEKGWIDKKKFCTHAMKKFIRSFWFTIRYHHHRITNRSQNLFGSNLLVDRLSGDQGRVLREICLSYLKRKKKKKKKKRFEQTWNRRMFETNQNRCKKRLIVDRDFFFFTFLLLFF